MSLFIAGTGRLSHPVQAQDALTPDETLTNTLTDSSHTYTLSLDSDTPFVLEVSGSDVYVYLSVQGQPVPPLNTETRDQDGMPITRLAYTSAPPETQVTVEGQGAYTLLLEENAGVGSTIALLRAGDLVNDKLLAGETHRYLLDADDDSLLTLSLITKQRSFFTQVINAEGDVMTPLLSIPNDEGFRELIQLRGSGPYSLYLAGINSYRLSWGEGDTISTATGSLALDKANEAPSGGGRYTIDTEESLISVVLDEYDAQTVLFDQTGARLAYDNRFYDQATRQRIVVYSLTGQAPYTLLIQSVNTYTVTIQSGDASQVDLGALAVNSTASGAVPNGQTPVYTIEAVGDDTLILTLFYDPETLRTSPPFMLVSSDGQITQPSRIWGGEGQIQAFLTPIGDPPYHLALALSGKFSLSLVQRQAAGVTVTLNTVDTNLRSGPTINATALRQGQIGETYTAIGLSADDQWVLLLAEDNTALWVFRQLVDVAPGATLTNLPLVQAASVGSETAAPLPTSTITTETQTAVPIIFPSPAATATIEIPFITVTPAGVICRIVSQGGVNVRQQPSTTGAIAGSLNDGQSMAVIGQALDDSERVWWQLIDLTWVRADVVSELGDCTLAPTIVIAQ